MTSFHKLLAVKRSGKKISYESSENENGIILFGSHNNEEKCVYI